MKEASARLGPVLLAEDNADYALLVRLAFKDARIGNPLHVVGDGDAAVEYLSACPPREERGGQPRPSLILLDLSLPGRSGFDVLEWLRTQPRFECLPVIVLTSSSDPGDMEHARALGVADYVVKPTRFADLVTVLASLAGTWLHGRSPCQESAGEASR